MHQQCCLNPCVALTQGNRVAADEQLAIQKQERSETNISESETAVDTSADIPALPNKVYYISFCFYIFFTLTFIFTFTSSTFTCTFSDKIIKHSSASHLHLHLHVLFQSYFQISNFLSIYILACQVDDQDMDAAVAHLDINGTAKPQVQHIPLGLCIQNLMDAIDFKNARLHFHAHFFNADVHFHLNLNLKFHLNWKFHL